MPQKGLLVSFDYRGYFLACSPAKADEQTSVQTLATQIEQGSAPLILDLRSPAEYAASHISVRAITTISILIATTRQSPNVTLTTATGLPSYYNIVQPF